MLEKLKEIGYVLLGILFFAGFIVAIVFLFKGTVWITIKVLPWLNLLNFLTILITILILLPLSIISRTRTIGAMGLFFASYVFGVVLWFWGFLYSYVLWGWLGLIIGLIIVGIGVVPVAIVACAINGMWSIVIQLLILVALTYGTTRVISTILLEKAENKKREAERCFLEIN